MYQDPSSKLFNKYVLYIYKSTQRNIPLPVICFKWYETWRHQGRWASPSPFSSSSSSAVTSSQRIVGCLRCRTRTRTINPSSPRGLCRQPSSEQVTRTMTPSSVSLSMNCCSPREHSTLLKDRWSAAEEEVGYRLPRDCKTRDWNNVNRW